MDEWHTKQKRRWFPRRKRCICGLDWPCVDARLLNLQRPARRPRAGDPPAALSRRATIAAMTTRVARRLALSALAVVVVLGGGWTLWYLALLAFGDEGALPPAWRIPTVPAGASVVERTTNCGSGGCWWQLTVAPAAGQSPQDLVREMGLTRQQEKPPALLDPASVFVGARPRENDVVISVGYE